MSSKFDKVKELRNNGVAIKQIAKITKLAWGNSQKVHAHGTAWQKTIQNFNQSGGFYRLSSTGTGQE